LFFTSVYEQYNIRILLAFRQDCEVASSGAIVKMNKIRYLNCSRVSHFYIEGYDRMIKWSTTGLVIITFFMISCSGAKIKDDEDSLARDRVIDELRHVCLGAESQTQIAACRKILKVRPSSTDIVHQLGRLLVKRGELPEGCAQLRKASKLMPKNAEVFYHLGLALEKRGDGAGALEAYKKSIKFETKNWETQLAYAKHLRKLGEKQEAEKVLRFVIEHNPNSARAWSQLSLVFAQQTKIEDAIEAANKVVELEPKDANARSVLGLFLSNAGRFDAAIAQLKQAVKLDPNNAAILYNLGLAYRGEGSLEEAAYTFYEALKIKQEFPQAQHSLAVVLIDLGLCQKSKEHFDLAHKLGVKSTPKILGKYSSSCEAEEKPSSPTEQ
jgi:Flp pilus assembly protein TadD